MMQEWPRELLPHLPVVIAVARRQGFAAAASALEMSPSAVSHAVRVVEQRIGEPLFARTTRSVALTEAGRRFVEAIGPALDAIGEAFTQASDLRGQVSGLLRINAPRIAGPMAITPILAQLARLHPGLTVEIESHDGFVDIVAAGFDAGIRLNEAVQQDMAVVRLTRPFRALMVASPAYGAERGWPKSLAELTAHNCIGFRAIGSGSLYRWDLAENGKPVVVPTRGSTIVTDAMQARDFALAGIGIAYLFEPLVAGDLSEGRLLPVLPECAIEEDGLFLYFPRRTSLAPKLRAFIATARECLRGGKELHRPSPDASVVRQNT